MNVKSVIKAMLPPVVLACLLGSVFLVPMNPEMLKSAISPDLPYGADLEGWHGVKTQAGEKERAVLAKDTKFSKGVYRRCTYALPDMPTLGGSESTQDMYAYGPSVSVSIVYSGSDMNASIHRPERCLPTQGHQELRHSTVDMRLPNGRIVSLSKLNSLTINDLSRGDVLRHIHYYVFIGHNTVTSSHLTRMLHDIYERIVKGTTQSWAYLQIGSYWGGDTGITEQDADEAVLELMGRLLERQIDWSTIKD